MFFLYEIRDLTFCT